MCVWGGGGSGCAGGGGQGIVKTSYSKHRHYEHCIFSKREHKVHSPYLTQFSHLSIESYLDTGIPT